MRKRRVARKVALEEEVGKIERDMALGIRDRGEGSEMLKKAESRESMKVFYNVRLFKF
jgi:hypothetical protein